MSSSTRWQFSIDVGGTFTDVVAFRPDGSLVTHKLLSSGVTRGRALFRDDCASFVDSARIADPVNFWVGYTVSMFTSDGTLMQRGTITTFDAQTGCFTFAPSLNSQPITDPHLPANSHPPLNPPPTHKTPLDPGLRASVNKDPHTAITTGCPKPDDRPAAAASTATNASKREIAYELSSREEAPMVAIRYLMGLTLNDPIGEVDVRLGTTRATNALLERTGARTAFVTTKGFGDILKIGYQDRPELFKLNIEKREEPASYVIEIDERLSATGQIIKAVNKQAIKAQLEQARQAGVESLAICLLHAYVNPVHEEIVADIAQTLDFRNVSVSSRVARMQKLVPRADTTVVDAYLTPVIREYIASLRSSLPLANLELMTSHGGLADETMIGGKDTLLSGPAGGVVGCAHIASQAGFEQCIGFDMGGTSTDVSRIERPPDRFEYQHETVKAGVRLMTPMLAIETVAAGGGSVCAFDGQRLRVGPRSAGADPGPACYGRGGPLTVTDMNLLLGKLPDTHFPFKLHRAVAADQLETLTDQMNSALGQSKEPVELAAGFVDIANANMAAAIKRISVAKGYDVRDYLLHCFGGAGGQHACAVAGLLGMKKILLHPLASLLSAVGIASANITRIDEQSVQCLLTQKDYSKSCTALKNMTEALHREITSGSPVIRDLDKPAWSWDLCYAGQASTITVPVSPPPTARQRFEKLHQQLYGYLHNKRDIEVRALRVELSEKNYDRTFHVTPLDQAAGIPLPRTKVYLDNRWRGVTVYERSTLTSGQTVEGPAIIAEDTTTLVLEPGWGAHVQPQGEIILTQLAAAQDHVPVKPEVDPIQLELFNRQFTSIAQQMGVTLQRTALSTNVKERLDFSCALFTASGDLVVNAPHIPVHLGGMSACLKALIDDVQNFAPGDVYVTNDPYRGGSHLNDITVVSPVHDASTAALIFFVANRAHHAEIGGIRPGSMPPNSTSLAEEGVLIRQFALVDQKQYRWAELRGLLTNAPYPSRSPDDNLADIEAQVAANRKGMQELLHLVERCGLSVATAYMHHIQKAAERSVRDALFRIPDRTYKFQDQLDDGSPICVSITIKKDHATVDFSGTGGVLAGNLNANQAIVTSAVLYCLRCLIDQDIPLNAGVLTPIDIRLPTCLLNPPRYDDPAQCAAVVGGNVETSQRVVDCILGALGLAAASQGTMNNLLVGDEHFGYYETICGGGGAGPTFDGASAVHTHMTNTRITDPEVLESRYPLRLHRFTIRSNSGGRGQHRGGDGVIREIEFLKPLELSLLSQRRTVPPYGLAGGLAGACGRNILRRVTDDSDTILPSMASVTVQPGDRVIIETPGGGGYGSGS